MRPTVKKVDEDYCIIMASISGIKEAWDDDVVSRCYHQRVISVSCSHEGLPEIIQFAHRLWSFHRRTKSLPIICHVDKPCPYKLMDIVITNKLFHKHTLWTSYALYLQGGPKMAHCTPYNYQILTNFQTVFIVIIRRKFVIILSWKVLPHLKHVKCQYLKATTESKTSVTTHFKKLTIGNVFIVSVKLVV